MNTECLLFDLKKAAIEKELSQGRTGEINPCSDKTWQQCITVEDGIPQPNGYLWYNDRDNSTRVVRFNSDTGEIMRREAQ